MEQIIHKLFAKYKRNLLKNVQSNGLNDLDAMTVELFENCEDFTVTTSK